MKKLPLLATVLTALAALLLAACGTNDNGNSSANNASTSASADEQTTNSTAKNSANNENGDGEFPITVVGSNGQVTIEARPEAIISLSPTGTEMLFAMGAGDQVIAVDTYSYYPAEAPVSDLSGFQPNVEAIAAYEPDLVVMSKDPGDVEDALGQIGIPVLVLSSAVELNDTYTQIETLGAATGNIADAAALVAKMQSEIDEIVASLPANPPTQTYYHELTDGLYSVSSNTFIGQVYSLLGLKSIGDEAEGVAASGGYPQLSAEFIVNADPDFIFLADALCCDQNLNTVAARPGWDNLAAVTNNRVIELDDDIASRWGPRIVDHLRLVADAVTTALAES